MMELGSYYFIKNKTHYFSKCFTKISKRNAKINNENLILSIFHLLEFRFYSDSDSKESK